MLDQGSSYKAENRFFIKGEWNEVFIAANNSISIWLQFVYG
ncbi:TPA: hypothetical protein ACFNMI_001013 [Neisseria bacilliformis]|jgi:hypothetical protein